MTIEEIAEAFSRHVFATTYPYIAEDVVWDNIDRPQITGTADLIETCNQSAAYLAGATTRFRRFRSVVGENTVVIDNLADYIDGDGETTTVASCDIYEFSDGLLVRITSYTHVVHDGTELIDVG